MNSPQGIEAYVPIRQLPSGHSMLFSPQQAGSFGPPQIEGMPVMPTFPSGLVPGAMPQGGVAGQPTAPVAPFNPVPLGVQMAERARLQQYPGPPSLGGLMLPIPPGPNP